MVISALKIAIRLLAQRALFSGQLKQKLLERGVEEEVASEVISLCQNRGYLNDQAYLERWVEKEAAKGKGPRYIAQALRAKGFGNPEQLIRKLEACEKQHLKATLKKRFGKIDWSEPKARNRAIHALQRRGFSLEGILSALK